MRCLGASNLDLLEQLFDALPDSPFFVKDADLRYVSANRAMARLCGVRRPSDLYGKVAGQVFPAAYARRYEAFDRQVLVTGQPLTNKLDLSLGAGAEPAWLVFSRLPVKAAGGATVGVTGVSRRLKPVERNNPTYQRLAVAVDHLQTNFQEPLRLDRLAAMAGISSAQLKRDFLRLFAVTPRAFHQHVRMERALALLDSDLSVTEVAHQCGYSDHSAFTRRFHEINGLAPRQYRQRLRTEPDRV